MSKIKAYVVSKGVSHPKGTDLDMVLAQLVHEYGYLTERVKLAKDATIVTISLQAILFNDRHFSTLKSRKPQGKSSPIVGIVMESGDHYRLIDGHHRLRWMMEREETEGDFILLSR